MSSTSTINVPALVGAFTAVRFLIIGVCFIPTLLEALAEYRQRRRNSLTAQAHPCGQPSIPSCRNIPPLTLQDIELDLIPVIHITRSPMGNTHQSDGAGVVELDPKKEAVWEVGKAV
jgi:hypothetical protein